MAIKLDMLRVFAAVARHGALDPAARELGRSPAAVSMMLKQLEEHLGAKLFETDRKNRLSALGRVVQGQADAAVAQFANAVSVIEGHASGRLGQVRIAMVPSVAGTILPALLAAKAEAYRGIALELSDMDSASVLRALRAERADLGIATLPRPEAALQGERLLADRFGVVCAAGHPLARRGGPIDWDDLDGAVVFANGLSAGLDRPDLRRLHGETPVTAHTMATILGLLRAGVGVTLLPKLAVAAVGGADLAFVPLADRRLQREIHLLRRAQGAPAPAVEMLARDIAAAARALGHG